jgi:hypothetical protein
MLCFDHDGDRDDEQKCEDARRERERKEQVMQ